MSGRSFFPDRLTKPFEAGLPVAFTFGAVAGALAALASLMRGKRYVHGDAVPGRRGEAVAPSAAPAALAAAAAPATTPVPPGGRGAHGPAREPVPALLERELPAPRARRRRPPRGP